MAIYELAGDRFVELRSTTFARAQVYERGDLQRLLREQIEIVVPDVMILSEEFGDWEDSRRRIDLLGLDRAANLVVIELKRTQDGGHMELQALRYAAMVSAMTFELAVEAHRAYLEARSVERDARASILDFLEWEAPDEERFAQDVRIILVSAEFSRELTTTVLWLNERDLDISCVRVRPHADGPRLFVDVQQVIPLPEASDYMVRMREKRHEQRASRWRTRSWAEIWHEFENQLTPEDLDVARKLYEWLQPRVSEVFPTADAFGVRVDVGRTRHHILKVEVYGNVRVWFMYLARKAPFAAESLRRELRDRLCRIRGVEIPDERLAGIPSIPLALLRSPEMFAIFAETIEWLIAQLKSAAGTEHSEPTAT